jgi:hypothetical protein
VDCRCKSHPNTVRRPSPLNLYRDFGAAMPDELIVELSITKRGYSSFTTVVYKRAYGYWLRLHDFFVRMHFQAFINCILLFAVHVLLFEPGILHSEYHLLGKQFG